MATKVNKSATKINMRILHRYLGFFLVGIMAVYSISGIILVFRNTDFLKRDHQITQTLEPGLPADKLGEALRIRGFRVTGEEGEKMLFAQGSYDKVSGEAVYTVKKMPYFIDKMIELHKAPSGHRLYLLNLFFGICLFFFVISSFWMFRPSSTIFRKGMYYTLGGIVVTLLILLV